MGVAFGGGAPISGRRIWSGAVLIWDPGLYEAGGGGAVGLGMFGVAGGSRGRLREYCIWGFVPGAGVIGGLVTGVGNRSSACWSGIGACGHIAPVLGLFWHGGETRMVR